MMKLMYLMAAGIFFIATAGAFAQSGDNVIALQESAVKQALFGGTTKVPLQRILSYIPKEYWVDVMYQLPPDNNKQVDISRVHFVLDNLQGSTSGRGRAVQMHSTVQASEGTSVTSNSQNMGLSSSVAPNSIIGSQTGMGRGAFQQMNANRRPGERQPASSIFYLNQ